MKGLGKALSGKSIFLNFYTVETEDQSIGFSSSFPGKIIPVDLRGEKPQS